MSSFTCLICPNGCGLSVVRDEDGFLVKGNRCAKGVGYARSRFRKQGSPGEFRSFRPFPSYSGDEIAAVLDRWDMPLSGLEEGRFIQGSPERSLYRTSLCSGKDRLILEQIEADRRLPCEKTGNRLERCRREGLPLSPFIRGRDGAFVQELDGRCWRLTPFVEGTGLDRSSYWQDAWRGRALGAFLSRLYALEEADEEEPVFDLPGFIRDLTKKISRHNPRLRSEMNPTIEPILERLESVLFPVYDKIPRVFGHGDCHPLNIIWGEDRILSVIDWEFSGTKPLLYDAALVLGCVGSEDPDAMGGAFNREFYRAFSPEIPGDLKALLPDFILALRFAWLNEWLRHDDREMIDQELYYMRCFHKGIL